MSGGVAVSILAIGGEEFEMVVEMGSCGIDYPGDWFGWCGFVVGGGVIACLWHGTAAFVIVVVATAAAVERFLLGHITPSRRLRRKV